MRIQNRVSGETRIGTTIAIVFLSFALLSGATAFSQNATQKPGKFPLWDFDEVNHSCRAKGRLQDKEYCESKMMNQIIAQGKDAIPILISQLTGTRKSKEPIEDYWYMTTEGDIAYFILGDLFTDSDWHTFTMPGLEALNHDCGEDVAAEPCWREFLKKHGRKFVQDQWLAAWNANKDRVYWDEKERCFRVSPKIEKR
jgi:hypothetical protein